MLDEATVRAILTEALLETSLNEEHEEVAVLKAGVAGDDPGEWAVQIDCESDPTYYILKRVPL